jgi:AraC-like DNA-binding protein
MQNNEMTAFVSSYLDAWNHRDSKALLGLMSSDVRYFDEAWQEEMTRDVLAEELADYFDSYPYQYELLGDIFCDGDRIAFQYCAKATTSQGHELRLTGADFITLRAGLAVEIRDYYQQPEPSDRQDDSEFGGQYLKSGLSRQDMAEILVEIEQALHGEQLYLDPSLSLPKLAAHLDTSVNHVSQAINAGLQSNFFNLINRSRVEASLKILDSDELPHPSTHEVASAVGFNSTSTFYSAFQKVMGITPGAYRRRTR